MSGHSKWKTIRLHKGKADVERGKLFGKLSRELSIAARLGGPNPDSNARLRLAIETARENSMPADNIKRAVAKGSGELATDNYEEVTYEGYGPGGVAVLVEAATDNRNRTVADLRHLFSRHGGNLGESGSVAWQFTRRGVITVPTTAGVEEDALLEVALDAGAQDLQQSGDDFLVICASDQLDTVSAALKAADIPVAHAELEMAPQNTIALEGDNARRMLRLMEALEDHDDVQRVAANFDIADDILQEQAA